MQRVFSEDDLCVIDTLLDTVQKVAFWIDVTDDNRFVFRKFSRHSLEAVTEDFDKMVGYTPHEVLPERLADTLAQNYETCRETAKPHTYEELLEFGSKLFWWNTCLSPVVDDAGRVVSIIGIAEDITDWKALAVDASAARNRVSMLTSKVRNFSMRSVEDVRGPCVALVSLMNYVMRDFEDLGDGKLQVLRQCEKMIHDLMLGIDKLSADASGLANFEVPAGTLDLGHLCADLCALIDPHKEYTIHFPMMTVETDRHALQSVLKAFVDNARAFAAERIEIEASDYGDGQIYFSIYDDGVGATDDFRNDGSILLPLGGADPACTAACDTISSLGGAVEAGVTEDGRSVEVSFSLPGRITQVVRQRLACSQDIDLTPGVAERLRLVN